VRKAENSDEFSAFLTKVRKAEHSDEDEESWPPRRM
jgi:hypothetical protein